MHRPWRPVAALALLVGCSGTESLDPKAFEPLSVPLKPAVSPIRGFADEWGTAVLVGADGRALRARFDGAPGALEPHPGNGAAVGAVSSVTPLGAHSALLATEGGLFVAQAGWIIAPPWRAHLAEQKIVGSAAMGGAAWIGTTTGLYRLLEGRLSEFLIDGTPVSGLKSLAVVQAADGTSTLYLARGLGLWSVRASGTDFSVRPVELHEIREPRALVGLSASPKGKGELWGLSGRSLFRVRGDSMTVFDAGDPVAEIAGGGRTLWVRAGDRLLHHDADVGGWGEAAGLQPVETLLAADASGAAWIQAGGQAFCVTKGPVPRLVGMDQNMRLYEAELPVSAILPALPGARNAEVLYRVDDGPEIEAKPPLFSLGGEDAEGRPRAYSFAALGPGLHVLTATVKLPDETTATRAVPFEYRPASGTGLSFDKDIKSIADARCAKCHTRGPGPDLAGYQQWKASTAKIVAAVRERRMPADGPLDPSLIQKIERWAAAGSQP